jgi:hypothetical protein
VSIQVGSSVHAAVTLYAAAGEGELPARFLQSPQGCILQRVPIGEGSSAPNAWIVLLDYGLDSGSTAFTCIPFGTVGTEEPRTQQPNPFIPILFHIDDRVKVLITVAPELNGEWYGWAPINQSFHALFLNFQANQQELYPVDIGILPEMPAQAPDLPGTPR